MSGQPVAIYRLPAANAARVGTVRVVRDRNGRYYTNGSKAEVTEEIGEFTGLTSADGRVYYVRTADLVALAGSRGKRK